MRIAQILLLTMAFFMAMVSAEQSEEFMYDDDALLADEADDEFEMNAAFLDAGNEMTLDAETELDIQAHAEANALADAEAELMADEDGDDAGNDAGAEEDVNDISQPEAYKEMATEYDATKGKPRLMTEDEIRDADGIAKISFKPAAEVVVDPATPKWLLSGKTYEHADIVDPPTQATPEYV
jgi:hypothetical protein